MNNCNNTLGYIFKKSATFNPTVQFVPVRDGLQSLEGATLTCGIMDGNGDRYSVTATLQPDNITVQLYAAAADTDKWVVGMGLIDLRYTINGTEELTETLAFTIEPNITLRS